MSTNASPAQAPDAAIQKASEDAMKSLAVLYKACHAMDPSGQACAAVNQIMQAVAEVGNNVAATSALGPAPNAGAPPAPEQGLQNPDPFAQAGMNVAQTMAQPQGLPPQ